MYITKLDIYNIRSFDEISIEFPRGKISAVITGNNGFGKTTLLRCIAMCLCDESSAAALFRELRGQFVRSKYSQNKEPVGWIDIYLKSYKYKEYIIHTKIKSLKNFETLEQIIYSGNQKKRNTV